MINEGIDDYDLLMVSVVVNDDEAAYYKLFNLFYTPLCVYAFRYIKSLQVREDLVQDVFLKLWRDRKSIRITSSIRTYLLVATRNHCLNYIRRKELEQSYEQSIINEFAEDSSSEELYSLVELQGMIDKAIANLPEKYRIVFEMNRFRNLTYREIAEIQGISVKTVEAHMSKALAILRVELKDYFVLLFIFYHI